MNDHNTQRRRIWINRMQKGMSVKREKATAPIRRTMWNLWIFAMGAKV